jgi:hypothetical protein
MPVALPICSLRSVPVASSLRFELTHVVFFFRNLNLATVAGSLCHGSID